MTQDQLKEEFGELTEYEKNKLADWIMLAKRIAELKKKTDIDEYVRERLREHRRVGENSESQK